MRDRESNVPEEPERPKKKLIDPGWGPEGQKQLERFRQWCEAQGQNLPSDTRHHEGKQAYDRLMLAYLEALDDVNPIVTNERLAHVPDLQRVLKKQLEEGDAEQSLKTIEQLRRMLDKIEQGIRAAVGS